MELTPGIKYSGAESKSSLESSTGILAEVESLKSGSELKTGHFSSFHFL